MPSHTSQWDPSALTSTTSDTVSNQTYDTARSSLGMSPLTEMSSTNDLSYLEDSQSRPKHCNAVAEQSVPYASGHTAPWDPYALSFWLLTRKRAYSQHLLILSVNFANDAAP